MATGLIHTSKMPNMRNHILPPQAHIPLIRSNNNAFVFIYDFKLKL